MSAEELDLAAIQALLRSARAAIYATNTLIAEPRWQTHPIQDERRENVALINSLASIVEKQTDEVSRLRKVIEDQPHGPECKPWRAKNWPDDPQVCVCWKASAVGTNNEEGN
jgi:hypothetical protein